LSGFRVNQALNLPHGFSRFFIALREQEEDQSSASKKQLNQGKSQRARLVGLLARERLKDA
jgi:hypothetical protein